MSEEENAGPEIEGEKLEIERRQLEIERENLQLEREKFALQLRQYRWTVTAVLVPFLVAMGTVAVSFHAFTEQAELQQKQAADQFEITAAQLVVNNNDPDVAYSRARALQELFPRRLPADWVEQFNPKQYCLPVRRPMRNARHSQRLT